MTIQEMIEYKQEKGYSYAKISELSGVPLSTVQKILSGQTTTPRYDTLQALESVFAPKKSIVMEVASSYGVDKEGPYTIDDYRSLPDEQRVELIDGVFYDMSSPTTLHQTIAGEIYRQIANYILENHGSCKPFISPVDVQLDCDEKTMVQPDVIIVCKEEIIEKWGIYGAPDFVVEVLSPSTKRKDCLKKLTKYAEAGVREYWMVDPDKRKIIAYFFEGDLYPVIFDFDQKVPVRIYDGKLEITFEYIIINKI